VLKVADARQFAKLDLGYFDNPKITDFVDEHPHVPLLHLRAILYSRQHLTDGKFPVRLVARMVSASYCGSQCDAECDYCRAVGADLIERVDVRTGLVHDYLQHQQSAEDIARLSSAGKKGAAARWSGSPDADRTPDRNANRNGTPHAKANAERGEERRGDRGAAAPGGTRIPDDFAVTPEMKQWAIDKGFDHLDLTAITEAFFDFWKGKPGAAGRKADWVATWRNWVRRDAADNRAPRRTTDTDPYAGFKTVEQLKAERGF
jgi:hypothetical protein